MTVRHLPGPAYGDPVGVALIGFAHSHGEKWAESLRDDERVRFVGAWDDDLERGKRTCDRLGIAFEPDLDALLDHPAVQAVAITSEHAQHPDHVERAAARGHAILCEKPLAIDGDGIERVRAAVERSGVRFMQAFHMRLDPAHQEARRLLQEGAVGQVASVRLRHSHDFGLIGWPHGVEDWYFDAPRSGGGVGFDEMIHAIDWLRWVLGEPESVTAESSSLLGRGVEDLLTAVFRMPGGVLATLESSWTATGGAVTHEVNGLAGTLLQIKTDISANRSPELVDAAVLLHPAGGEDWQRPDVESVMGGKPHHRVPREFVRCLLTGEAFATGLEDGVRGVELVLATYEAAATGRRIHLTEGSTR